MLNVFNTCLHWIVMMQWVTGGVDWTGTGTWQEKNHACSLLLMLVMQLKSQEMGTRIDYATAGERWVMKLYFLCRMPYDGLISEPGVSCDFSWLLVAILLGCYYVSWGLFVFSCFCAFIFYTVFTNSLDENSAKMILSICMEFFLAYLFIDLITFWYIFVIHIERQTNHCFMPEWS